MTTASNELTGKSRSQLSRRAFTKVAGGSVAGLTLTGHATGVSHSAASQAEPTGTITYLTSSNFIGNWNPYANLVLSHMRAQRVVYDYLMWFDEAGNVIPGLAESIENVEPTVWEAKLRQGVKFHDGQDFTARDVKASLELASNPTSVTGSLFPGQLSVEVVDDFTARITTPEPFAALLTGTLAGNQSGAIISHEDAEQGEEWLSQRMNGTGAFKWVGYEGEANGLQLTANTEYWRGNPQVQNVVIQYVPDGSTRLAALQTGQADIVEALAPDEALALEGNPDFQVLRTLSTDSINIAFRVNKEPMDNVGVRQAIASAINVPAIVENLLLGYAQVSDAFIPSITMYYQANPDYFSYDPERARTLLAEAGFPDGEGLPELSLIAAVGQYAKSVEIAQFIVQNLGEVGIDVSVQTLESSAFNDALFQLDMGDMVMHGWLVPTPDRQSWYTSLFRSEGLITGFSNAEVDQAIADQSQAIDPDERASIIQNELHPLLVELVPEFPMYTYELITGVSAKISGLEIPSWYEFDLLPVSKSE